jgi:serine/threonine protein kinase
MAGVDPIKPLLAVGSEVAGYRVEAFISRGGMAVVYRAHDRRLGRRVALKLLAPELSQDERFQQRFLRESRLAASLDHPNIIPIYEAGSRATSRRCLTGTVRWSSPAWPRSSARSAPRWTRPTPAGWSTGT